MGTLLHFHTLKRPNSLEALTVNTNVQALTNFSSRKQRPCLVVAEKTNNNGENAGKQQGANKTTSNPRRENGFWSKLRMGQETPAQSKEDKDKKNTFWDSFASGNGGDLGQIEPLKIGLTDLLDPDPENMLAVGLIGLLAWATAQICWQLFFVSLAIAVAALKYSFIAAVLLFILVTLL